MSEWRCPDTLTELIAEDAFALRARALFVVLLGAIVGGAVAWAAASQR